MKPDESINVLGEPLESCSEDPLTGFFRDGKCNTCDQDHGSHTVCVKASQEFLQYTRFAGNDLSTPRAEFNFPGVQPDQSWCLCAARWLQAYQHNRAPKVYLRKTHIRALDIIPLELLKQFAIDLN